MITLNHIRKNTSGSITVETALILPILILMCMGTVDLALAINQKMMLSNAVRAGMQYGIVHKPIDGDYSEILAAVRNALPDSARNTVVLTSSMHCSCLDTNNAIACVNSSTNSDTICDDGSLRASFLKIELRATYNTLLNYPGVVDGGQINFQEEINVRLNGGH
ncbi:hypothetical protein GCM10017044_01230 [Kordiimonas sediminis]|uniref:TadE-like domain-containing protein n=1 Tax=Kordiimonas sediminis TaxID=1735581 RepID=A0A919AL99_9PROT|nr:TadE/TadG family type IV pilus assembly protein [Kordiimonas sediminis]GHF11250.1 hypothetical protein GCM10017044_01230 [Kordiimonas sediminis]